MNPKVDVIKGGGNTTIFVFSKKGRIWNRRQKETPIAESADLR